MNKRLLLFPLCLLPVSAQLHATPAVGPQIIGGEPAPKGAYPWMAALVTSGGNPYLDQYCGATLIHPRWALTAAHCFADTHGRLHPEEAVDLIIGRHDLWYDEDGVRVQAVGARIHPDFDLNTMDGDLALVELSAPVAGVAPVRLPGQRVDQPLLAPGTEAIALGWGDVDIDPYRADYPTALYQVTLPIVDPQQCGPETAGHALTGNMICAGLPQGGKDTCQGDSGGPLLTRGDRGEWMQTGVTSFGAGCATPASYGIYTRVSSFAAWISDTLCGEGERPGTTHLAVAIDGTRAAADFLPAPGAEGHRLYYAPYPQMSPVAYIDLYDQHHFAVDLPAGSAWFAAVLPYNGNCLGTLSNIESVSIQ